MDDVGKLTKVSDTLAPRSAPSVTGRTEPTLDDGDHERLAHIVLEGFRPVEGGEFIPAGTNVVEGMVTGTPVKALCGKVWIPGRDPARYSLCPTCREIAESRGWKVPAR
jgi:hypothetical protein